MYYTVALLLALTGWACLEKEKPALVSAQMFQTDRGVLEFSQPFLKGVARSLYQDGGHHTWHSPSPEIKSNWSWFENHHIKWSARTFSFIGQSPIKNNQKVGNAADGWNKAYADIALLAQLGCNAQRFSVEWAEIEPREGEFNQEALTFYERYCDALRAHNITPMITLHHFVHPLWFEDKGAFTKQENIQYFVRYAQQVFNRLGGKVHLWCTINEPTVLAACGYILGIHPPGKVLQLHMAGLVLKHLLQAHVQTYRVLKNSTYGEQAQIGLVHQMLCFEPYFYKMPLKYTLRNPVGLIMAHILNGSFAHGAVKKFLQTGLFEYRVLPGMTPIKYADLMAPYSYDFIGLNFYSKVVLGLGPTHFEGHIKTDMDYAIRPDALYEAIHEMSVLRKPIYVTETGIADAADDRRVFFIKQYMNAIYQTVQEGIDVRGVFYWTLLDNFEWNDGFDMQFGLFHVDRTTQKRTLRSGACTYRDYVTIKKVTPEKPGVL